MAEIALTPHHPIHQFFPLHRQRNVVTRGVNVPFGNFHGTVSHRGFDLKHRCAALGQSCTESMSFNAL